MLPTRFWAEMVWTDFKAEEMSDVIAVLPVAAVEQHGPHLPLGVDLFLMQAYIDRVAERLPDDLPVLFLPVQAIGASIEHSDFPGTLSLSAATLDARPDRDRRKRPSRRLPQARSAQFAWRQCRAARHCRA